MSIPQSPISESQPEKIKWLPRSAHELQRRCALMKKARNFDLFTSLVRENWFLFLLHSDSTMRWLIGSICDGKWLVLSLTGIPGSWRTIGGPHLVIVSWRYSGEEIVFDSSKITQSNDCITWGEGLSKKTNLVKPALAWEELAIVDRYSLHGRCFCRLLCSWLWPHRALILRQTGQKNNSFLPWNN